LKIGDRVSQALTHSMDVFQVGDVLKDLFTEHCNLSPPAAGKYVCNVKGLRKNDLGDTSF